MPTSLRSKYRSIKTLSDKFNINVESNAGITGKEYKRISLNILKLKVKLIIRYVI